MAAAASPQDEKQFRFMKRLVHNSATVRTKALNILTKWLSRKSLMQPEDMAKIWRGIFYCYWMSDKRPVQHELAWKLGGLSHSLRPNRFLLYLQGFLECMNREWIGIDRLRMDKFMNLYRQILHHVFRYLRARDWDPELLHQVSRLWLQHPLDSKDQMAMDVFLHFCDVFVEELIAVHRREPTPVLEYETLDRILEPFYHILRRPLDKRLSRRIQTAIFGPLLEHTKLDPKTAQASSDTDPLHAVLFGKAGRFSRTLFLLAAEPGLQPGPRKVLYQIQKGFQLAEDAWKASAPEAHVVQEDLWIQKHILDRPCSQHLETEFRPDPSNTHLTGKKRPREEDSENGTLEDASSGEEEEQDGEAAESGEEDIRDEEDGSSLQVREDEEKGNGEDTPKKGRRAAQQQQKQQKKKQQTPPSKAATPPARKKQKVTAAPTNPTSTAALRTPQPQRTGKTRASSRTAAPKSAPRRVRFELKHNQVQIFKKLETVTPKKPTKILLAQSPDELKPALRVRPFSPQPGFPPLFEKEALERFRSESPSLNLVIQELQRSGALDSSQEILRNVKSRQTRRQRSKATTQHRR